MLRCTSLALYHDKKSFQADKWPLIDDISAFGKRRGISKQEGRVSIYDGELDYEEYAVPSLDRAGRF